MELKKLIAAATALGLTFWSNEGLAQSNLLLLGVGGSQPTSGAGYTGPGDIAAGASLWVGLRAYKASYATGSNPAVIVRRAKDNTTQTINILANGALDVASAASFAGTDATCSGSTSGSSTTLIVTGCSGTIQAYDPISGTGVTQPAFAVSCSIVSGAGTCTLNQAQNIASAVTITFQDALFVGTWYDQSGNGINATQSTNASQPQLLLTGGGGGTSPAVYCNLTGNTNITFGANSATSQPYSFEFVGASTPGFAGPGEIIRTESGNAVLARWLSSTQLQAFAGSNLNSSTIVNGSWQAGLAIYNDGGSASAIVVNGSSTTGSVGTNSLNSSAALTICNGGAQFSGYVSEVGLWHSGFSSGNQTSLTSNARTYWGF